MAADEGPSGAEGRKARRKERLKSERAGARALSELTDAAVEAALQLAPEVAGDRTHGNRERAIDLAFPTRDAARHARRRINEALFAEEWLDEIEVWLWEDGVSTRKPLTEHGRRDGYELRLGQRRR